MDLWPLPCDPAQTTLDIPYLAFEPYDGGDFLTYLDRHDWTILGTPGGATITHKGEAADLHAVGAILQTWLLLGLPSQFLARDLDLNLIRAQNVSGRPTVSTRPIGDLVSRWSTALTQEEWTYDTEKIAAWTAKMLGFILRGRHVVMFLRSTPAYDDLQTTFLAVATVGEYLLQVLRDICNVRHISPPRREVWRVPDVADCAGLLLQLMLATGWCPSKLARLEATTTISTAKFWYLANLKLVQSQLDHRHCTRKLCRHDWVDWDSYRPKHEGDGCQCQLQGADRREILAILGQGHIPLLWFDSDQPKSSGLRLLAEPREDHSLYVAISHVWADGHGNHHENKLPECFLTTLSNIVRTLPGNPTRFWIDTICVPLAPYDARRQAIVKLREPYELAAYVLVLDDTLRCVSAQGLSPVELVARIEFSRWSTRLWTFQEGRLGRRLFFQFNDGPVELFEQVEYVWRESFSRIPSLPSHVVDIEILIHYTRSRLWQYDQQLNDSYVQLPIIRRSLCPRTTSQASDEAICLANIMNLDVERIYDTPPAERMATFWSLLSKIPPGLAFSFATHKLTQPGFRWAPASVMGEIDNIKWQGPTRIDPKLEARVSPNGLLLTAPTLLIRSIHGAKLYVQSSNKNIIRGAESLTLIDGAREYYDLIFEENWHQEMCAPTEFSDFAILLTQAPVNMEADGGPYHDFTPQWVETGILVTLDWSQCQPDLQTPIPAQVIRHIKIAKASPGYKPFGDRIWRHAEILIEMMQTESESKTKGCDATGFDARMRTEAGNFLRREPEAADLLNRMGQFHSPNSVVEDFEEIYVANTLKNLVRQWPMVEIDAGPRMIEWCLD